MFKSKVTIHDLFAVLAVLVAAGVLLCASLTADTGALLEVVTPEERNVYTLSEKQELTVVSNGITLHILIENGAARVLESDCPDGVCVSGGAISKTGESLLCAPAGVVLRVKGGDGDVDFVAG